MPTNPHNPCKGRPYPEHRFVRALASPVTAILRARHRVGGRRGVTWMPVCKILRTRLDAALRWLWLIFLDRSRRAFAILRQMAALTLHLGFPISDRRLVLDRHGQPSDLCNSRVYANFLNLQCPQAAERMSAASLSCPVAKLQVPVATSTRNPDQQ